MIEQEKAAKMFLFLQHTLNYHGLHQVLVNAAHFMELSDILNYNVFVVVVQKLVFSLQISVIGNIAHSIVKKICWDDRIAEPQLMTE